MSFGCGEPSGCIRLASYLLPRAIGGLNICGSACDIGVGITGSLKPLQAIVDDSVSASMRAVSYTNPIHLDRVVGDRLIRRRIHISGHFIAQDSHRSARGTIANPILGTNSVVIGLPRGEDRSHGVREELVY